MLPEEKKAYTLNDVARDLGVNKATVSKAISGKGNLSAETRARILQYIDKCGYRPNAVAQSLARNRTFNIGLIIPGDVGVFDMAFFRDCLQGACMAASESGYDVLITMDSRHPVDQIARLIEHRKIDGVIAMRNLIDSPVVGFLKEKRFPFVLVGESSDPDVVSVDNDNRSACRDMTALLLSRGVRKPALLGGDENNCVTHSRLEGFLDACCRSGLREAPLVFLTVHRDDRLRSALDAAADGGADCLICMDDYICNMVLSLLRFRGIRVPEEVAVASFYDNVLLQGNVPPITSLHFDATGLGRIACGELIRMMEGKDGESVTPPAYRSLLRESTK